MRILLLSIVGRGAEEVLTAYAVTRSNAYPHFVFAEFKRLSGNLGLST